MKRQKYEVAVSYASEQRPYVERFVARLQSQKMRVYYDRNAQAKMVGKILDQELHKIYLQESKCCILFLSNAYVEKPVTRCKSKNDRRRHHEVGNYAARRECRHCGEDQSVVATGYEADTYSHQRSADNRSQNAGNRRPLKTQTSLTHGCRDCSRNRGNDRNECDLACWRHSKRKAALDQVSERPSR